MDVVTLGETLICFNPCQQGRLEHVQQFWKSIGGAESNTAIGLARLGTSVSWISRVGADPFGQEVLTTIRGEGVDVTRVKEDPTLPTGLMVKEFHDFGSTRVFYYRNHSAATSLSEEDIDESAIAQARQVHFTGITLALGEGPRAAIRRTLALCEKHGVRVSFDPNLRMKLWSLETAISEIRAVLPFVDDLLLNEDEALKCTVSSTKEEAVERLADFDIDVVVIKCGQQGAEAVNKGRRILAPGVTAGRTVDTVGAGDAFNAGFIDARLRGLSLEDSLARGNRTGARVVAHHGDWEGLPFRQDLDDSNDFSMVER